MAGVTRSGPRRQSPERRDTSTGDEHSELEDTLRVIVRVLARQAAREIFERECTLESERNTDGDQP
jgi:hypothetical protein